MFSMLFAKKHAKTNYAFKSYVSIKFDNVKVIAMLKYNNYLKIRFRGILIFNIILRFILTNNL